MELGIFFRESIKNWNDAANHKALLNWHALAHSSNLPPPAAPKTLPLSSHMNEMKDELESIATPLNKCFDI